MILPNPVHINAYLDTLTEVREEFGMSSPFRNYDRWLTTDRAAERAEAEWDAYEDWCLKLDPPKEPLENPSLDEDWQDQCRAWNEAQAEAEAEAFAEYDRTCVIRPTGVDVLDGGRRDA